MPKAIAVVPCDSLSVITGTITGLVADACGLVAIDFHGMPLTNASLDGNFLTVADFSDIPLTSLSISNNQLVALITGAEITTLDCSFNSLTSIDTSGDLAVLNCSNNSLAALSLTNFSLTDLRCANNQLTELDISGNPGIIYLDAFNNVLTEAAVDAILESLVIAGLVGAYTVNLGGTNSAPSAAGDANADILTTRGWTVTVN